ncbi:hypothetical protein CIB95_15815 [Lottiidibacillus patelloidae]|uniref:MerR family transcriptional regulator n=1 Tax=Lottiidibacillus patelloidae TaxID=2670334 RepID=A0A263BQT8_9BACI|nr:MerR family transcriptional regulator [Lottiidibacillus patelloidae]OZM55737.1 hypothetical protein CIB95_15815 [Lottiidibacillus patelloidae]
MYSIKRVSEMLNIPAVTIRAWESRYNIINPTRTEGGHRLYSEEEVAIIKWLKEQTEDNNMKISEAVRMLESMKPFKDKKVESSPSNEKLVVSNNYNNNIEQLYSNIIDLNNHQANETMDIAFSMYHYEDVFHKILAPTLHLIGDNWEKGNISVAQEHFGSQIILQRFNQFYRTLPVNPLAPKGLSICPEGEEHHIGLMLFSLFLRKKGSDVIYLGPNTLLENIPEIIKEKDIKIIAISSSSPKNIAKLEKWLGLLKEKFPRLKIVVGGRGFANSRESFSFHVLSSEVTSWEKWYENNISK